MKRLGVISLLLLFCLNFIQANGGEIAKDTNKCLPVRVIPKEELAFSDGEYLKYVINYRWLGIRTDVGYGEVEVKKIGNNGGRDVYHAVAQGKTYKFWDVFFKVRDLYEAKFYGDNIRPIYFHRDVYEGRYTMKNFFDFDERNNTIQARVERKKETPIDTLLRGRECTFDLISLFYFARNIDFESLDIGVNYPVSFVIDNELIDLYFRYIGKEEKKIPGLGTKKTMKFAAKLVAGEVFTGEEEMFLWVSDDKYRIPVFIESPILVGSIQGRLVDYRLGTE